MPSKMANWAVDCALYLNPYDISKPREGVLEETLCYPATTFVLPSVMRDELRPRVRRNIAKYLNRPFVRAQLRVDPSVTKNMSSRDPDVSSAFSKTYDTLRNSQDHVGGLLEHGVRVLIYVGTND